ncbi:hypothetical protein [Bradyrhizobium sp. ARR65]|nr:hypothetical protein [Bradyrhizobium sp. ARR65]
MNTTAINDTVLDLGDATELTEGLGGASRAEPATGDYYLEGDCD